MTEPSRYDVVIAGGGLVGLALAAALGQAGLDILVVDDHSRPGRLEPLFDGRVSAVAQGSRRILEGIGVWQGVAAEAEPIREIRVADRGSPLFLHYDHRTIGDEPLGYIVENRHLRGALFAAIDRLPNVRHQAPGRVTAVETISAGGLATLTDAAGAAQIVRTRLVVAADGHGSTLRQAAGIETIGWRYDQQGIVATVAHERPHHGVAVEHFMPAGPFAILPMTERRSSLVWTEAAARVPGLMAAPETIFLQEMRRRFGDFLGATEIVGPRWCYPLSLQLARRFVGSRLALIGEAAHVIHPIAGQGFNLSLRGVAVLAELVVDRDRLGLDIGAPDLLERYERRRRFDTVVLAGVTDGLNRLFSTSMAPVQAVRDLGLGLVQQLPPAKRLLMRHAMGLVGDDLPRLVRGEAL